MLQFRLWLGDAGVPVVNDLQDQVKTQTEHNRKLLLRNQTLYAEVRNLKSGLAAMEGRARYDMGMVKENETFYMIVK